MTLALHGILVRMQNYWNAQTLLVEMQNGLADLEETILSYRVKHLLTLLPSNSISKFFYRRKMKT